MPYFPEVVRIIAAHMDGPTGGKAIGTGFFLAVDGQQVKEEGLLLTNAHVVTNSPVVKIMTTYIEHQALPVTVVSVCHDRDLALLKVEPSVQQWLKRTLYERFQLDHIPAMSFGDSDTLRTGTEVHAVGHPLGLVDQQCTTGQYQGVVHLNSEIRGLSGALINGGNSGGPLIRTLDHAVTPVAGLHYFVPSKYELMGINTFKLTGANVDGENGFIHVNTVKHVLPTLMAPLKVRYEREKAVMTMLGKMSTSATATAAPTAAAASAVMDHLSEEECAYFHSELETLSDAWSKQRLGGMVGGRPRSWMSWMCRHVLMPGTQHMHNGGAELLSTVLGYAKDNDWEGLKAWKDGRRWGEVRLAAADASDAMPSVVRILPPAPTHVHSPIVGITSTPLYTGDLLVHYECARGANHKFTGVEGGVLVTDVTEQSLYAQAGGQEGDIVVQFANQDTTAKLGWGGTWYSEKRDLPMSLTDLCNDTPIGASITLSVLRPGGVATTLSFPHREPKYQELPEVRQLYPYCDEGRFESKMKAQVQGIVFTPLRLQHVSMFKLVDYMVPTNRDAFKVVVEGVSPESPAYATDAVRPGAIVTHINDAPVASNWKDFVQQLSAPHPKTGCWVLNTNHNGTKNKFAMVARKVQTK